MRIILISIMMLFSGIAYAITEQEARDIVDTIFTKQFGANYVNNVLFYDGTVFREAYALARSGPVSSGGCGYDLVNMAIAITFDMATDSAWGLGGSNHSVNHESTSHLQFIYGAVYGRRFFGGYDSGPGWR